MLLVSHPCHKRRSSPHALVTEYFLLPLSADESAVLYKQAVNTRRKGGANLHERAMKWLSLLYPLLDTFEGSCDLLVRYDGGSVISV
jgi:hypothetical protein